VSVVHVKWRYVERDVVVRRGWFGRVVTCRAVVIEVFDPEAFVYAPGSHTRGVWRLASPLEAAFLTPESRQ
jgi:hypothetical protein